MVNGHDINRARDALYSIPPDVSHDPWVKAGMAFHAAGGDFETFDQWSAPAGNYNSQDCASTWRSFKSTPGGVGAGSLFRMAREHGWNENNISKRSAPTARPVKPPPKPAKGMSAAEIWGRGDAATAQHGYVVIKAAVGVPLDTLRVVPAGDSLNVAKQSMVGYLMVPAYAPDGELQSIQFIPPTSAGKKLNLSGPMAGATFTVGPADGLVYLCEGIGAAWAVWQATGRRAVVCFGWGNVRRVAKALLEQDPSVQLVLVPDSGKEADAEKIARDVGAAVAAMPPGWPNNSDVSDLAMAEGIGVLAVLLGSAVEPPKPEPTVHPLARFLQFDPTPKPPRWVLPGLIDEGVLVISGASGVGKTTAVLPMAMIAAGLIASELEPKHWRHVIYVTEDSNQAQRIVAGIVTHSNLGVNKDLVDARFHLVDAKRLTPASVVSVGGTYRDLFTRSVRGVEILPLVVFDTKSAVFELDNENDNSETSRMMAAIKQDFEGLPVWLIGHVAKANIGKTELAGLSGRGAGSSDGDGNATAFLLREADDRFFVLGKVRFEPKWFELEIPSYTAHTMVVDEFGDIEPLVLRWGIPALPTQSRKEAAGHAADLKRKGDESVLRQEIRDVIDTACLTGNPLNRAGVKAKVQRKAANVVATLEILLSERWLYEVTVPVKDRTNNNRSEFLVNLTTVEHEAVLSGAGLPAAKLVIPASWKKEPIPSVPAPQVEAVGDDHVEQ
jgi:hypothetical protein